MRKEQAAALWLKNCPRTGKRLLADIAHLRQPWSIEFKLVRLLPTRHPRGPTWMFISGHLQLRPVPLTPAELLRAALPHGLASRLIASLTHASPAPAYWPGRTNHGARHQHCLGSDNRLCFQYLCPLALTDTVVVPARKSPLPHGKPRGGSGVARTVQAPPQDVGVKPAHLLGSGSPWALHTLAGTREPATRHTHTTEAPCGCLCTVFYQIRAGLESNYHLIKPAEEELLLPPFCKRANQGQELCQRSNKVSFAPAPTVGMNVIKDGRSCSDVPEHQEKLAGSAGRCPGEPGNSFLDMHLTIELQKREEHQRPSSPRPAGWGRLFSCAAATVRVFLLGAERPPCSVFLVTLLWAGSSPSLPFTEKTLGASEAGPAQGQLSQCRPTQGHRPGKEARP
ncbi:uncharacterized protein [Tursiops truncatus]|uniref:uncharacterized protein n=1 Tax=Tursiops truncatus TaxID=9739 RepID=UPI003CCF2013